ncbi:hypothetical protein B0S90_2689 [Caldicellulosiruptor bescii]|uniref:Uncharacterized protein n=1 Tax=Caldicellulosiruptor bescii TaxID=31899 RepID=A0ABY1S697_CALBS|nr:hypothetical protein B0S87_1802 [Caldicellulosiruptor bescii]PBC91750.1 hypothetical protein B0S89_2190 [Caldicellulosiruptor bescii]PBD02838.1 hypothetical protein B0S85_0382 [Caldicellulosiruptor bescii]PBD07546.1 hypothetical protein B0S90_2689 [Caldicellulosiruptor bescii]PBD10111.1 hypothetical protein B0S84_2605 [Caldicellulosiruptor bescii]
MIIKFLLFDYKKSFKNYFALGLLTGLYIFFGKTLSLENCHLEIFALFF